MATMISAPHDALRGVGAVDGTARKAAGEVAGVQRGFAEVEGELPAIEWMIGFNLAITVAVPARLLA